MASKYRNSFFENKRDWSKYKDSILNYYLIPYLQKVKELKKPICVVDMFAGRGEFLSGEKGSPLIIAAHLQKLAQQGHEVKLRCYENHEPFYEHLAAVLKPFSFAEALSKDCFSDVANIARLASTHTMFLYIDPCDVVQLSLSKLGMIFDKVRQNSSVEALIVFMARAFMRQAALSLKMEMDGTKASSDPGLYATEEDDKAMWEEVASQSVQSQKQQTLLSNIAGGDYWQAIVQDTNVSWKERCATLVDKYCLKLRNWFNVVEALPVHSDQFLTPKYWIVFMSRYAPAFDLFNRAACDMLRSQSQNKETLFVENEPSSSTVPHQTVDSAVKSTARSNLPCQWNKLRWCVCGSRNVGRFTDSEVNQSIKRLLKNGWLRGAAGNKVDEEATLEIHQ